MRSCVPAKFKFLSLLFGLSLSSSYYSFSQNATEGAQLQANDAIDEVEQAVNEARSDLDKLVDQAAQEQQANSPTEKSQSDQKKNEEKAQSTEPEEVFTPAPPLEKIPSISQGLITPAVYSQEMPLGQDDLRIMQNYQRELGNRLRSATCVIRIGQASGSGVFISHDGLIASAAHVTGKPGKKLTIVLPDGTELKGRALTANPEIDGSFAMLEPGQIKKPLPWVEFAELGEQRIGDWSMACGNSGGWDASRGSVIRVGRLVRISPEVIQTDSPLIGGDSGGPMMDIYGRLLGTNSRVGGTARHSLHVPLEYFLENEQEARKQFDMANSEGTKSLLLYLKKDAAQKARERGDELIEQARKQQEEEQKEAEPNDQLSELDKKLDQAREAQQAQQNSPSKQPKKD